MRFLFYSKFSGFSTINHIQGPAKASAKLGLFHNNELVSIMSFGKSRFKKDELELIRYCTKLNTQVIGGFSKLVKYFGKSFITYCDLIYSNGAGYLKNGFNLIDTTKPNYWYFKNNSIDLQPRQKYQKHRLSAILKSFDPKLTEHENMRNNGYLRIFDCGNLKLEYNMLNIRK